MELNISIDSCILDVIVDEFLATNYQHICDSCKREFSTKISSTECHICIATHNTHYFDVLNIPECNKYIFICSCGMFREIDK